MPERLDLDAVRPVRAPPTGVVIRAAREPDDAAIERLALDIVREVYGDLIPEAAPHRAGDWRGALKAEVDGRILGVVERRREGIGSVLLAAAERHIAARGHAEGRLRVVARNLDTRRFYGAQGWTETASYPHESWGFMMIEMANELAP